MADIIGDYTVKDAALSAYLIKHMGREIRIAQAVREIEPNARPLIRRITVREWREGEPVANDPDGNPLPYAIEADYDPVFAQFVFTLEHAPDADADDKAKLAGLDTARLRELYWEAVQNGYDAHLSSNAQAHTIAERDKRLILAVITGRGEKV